MSNSSLVDYTRISPNSSIRTAKIDTITIHHMAGNFSVESCGDGFANPNRKASSNYGIGTDGRVGLYVDESRRSWCSSNYQNDNRAITIEVANDSREPEWHVSDTALAKLIELCVDICKRNNIEYLNYTGDTTGNLTMHCWFQPTLCPGTYLKGKFTYIANEVNKRLGVTDKILEEIKPEFEIGERVSLISGAKYNDGNGCPSFLFNTTLYVRKIDGSYITISTLKTGAVTGVVHKDYLKSLDNTSSSPSITPSTSVTEKNETNNDIYFKLGDEVKLIAGAKYSNGQSIPSWLFAKTLYVRNIYPNSDDITISTLKTGAITGIVNKKYLVSADDDSKDGNSKDGNSKEEPTTPKEEVNNDIDFKLGDKVKLIAGAKYKDGKSVPSWLFGKTLYVRKIYPNDDNIVVSILKVGAITGAVHKKYLTKC